MLLRLIPTLVLLVSLVSALPAFGQAARLLHHNTAGKDVFAYRLYEKHVPTFMQRGLYNDWISHPLMKERLVDASNQEVALLYLSDVNTAIATIQAHNVPPVVWERSEYAQVFQYLHERFKTELEAHWEEQIRESLWRLRLTGLKKSRSKTKNKFRKQGL